MADGTMDAIFGAQDTVTEAVASETPASKERNEKMRAMKEGFKTALMNDPTLKDRCGIYSQNLEVVNVLGYGKGGNIKVDKKQSTKENRVIEPTAKVVGYILKNNGDVAIDYTTEEFAKDETGKFVGTVVKKTWQPGETIMLNRKYTTMLCSIAEISFTLSNGKFVMQSIKNKGLNDILSACYFQFNSDLGISVNDDAVKLSIDVDKVVKPEYEKTFGDLNNPKASKQRTKSAGGAKYSVQDYAANFVQQMLKESGLS